MAITEEQIEEVAELLADFCPVIIRELSDVDELEQLQKVRDYIHDPEIKALIAEIQGG